jgi:hypothetical protein
MKINHKGYTLELSLGEIGTIMSALSLAVQSRTMYVEAKECPFFCLHKVFVEQTGFHADTQKRLEELLEQRAEKHI